MTRSIGDVFLTVRADLTQFQADLTGLNSQVSRSATELGRSLTNVGRNLSSTGAAMTRSLTLPLVAAGAAATHFALDFDTQMREIVALTDVTEDQIGGITEAIEEMGPAVGKGPQELGEAFYFVASAGFEAAEAMEVLEIAAKASASGMGTTQDVAKVLAGVINAYGHENLDAATAADQLTAAVQKGSAEASDFAGVIGRVAPGAAALGVSFDQVTAALAGMTNVGISADEAATSLVQIFSALLKPTVQADQAMQGLGLSAAGLRRQLREEGLLATLRTLEEAFGNNETASAAVFGNIRALRGVTALLGIDTEQLNSIFAATEDSLGALGDAYDETEGPQRELDRAVAQFEVTMTQLGADVLPVVVDMMTDLAEVVKALGEAWMGLDKDTRKTVVQFLAFAAAAGPVLFIVGKLVGAFGALFKAVGFLTSAKGLASLPARLGAFMRAAGRIAPVLALVGVLLEVPDAIKGVEKSIDGFVTNSPRKVLQGMRLLNRILEANPFGGSMGGINEAVFDEIERQIDATAEHVEGTFAGWGERHGPIVQPVEEAVDLVGQVLEDGSVQIGNAADMGIEDPIAEAAAAARHAVSEAVLGLIADTEASLAATPDQIDDELQAIVDALADPYTNAERLADIRGGLISAALRRGLTSGDELLETQTFNQTMDWLHQWELLDPDIYTTGSGFLDQLTDGMESNLQTALDWVTQKMGIEFVSEWDLADQLEDAGFAGLAAYVRGMATVRPTAEQKARELARAARQAALTGADWYGAGAAVIYSFADGMWSGRGYLNDKAEQLKAGLTHILQYADSPPYTHSREIGEQVGLSWAEGIGLAVRDAATSVRGQVGGVSDALAMGLPALGSGLSPAATLQPVGVSAAVGAGAGGIVNNYNLNVSGALRVDEARDAIDELRRLAT